jgi:hypothetical protein
LEGCGKAGKFLGIISGRNFDPGTGYPGYAYPVWPYAYAYAYLDLRMMPRGMM